MKDLLRTTVVILATVAVLLLLWSIRQVCVLLLIGITLATLTAPAIESLVRRGMSRMLANMIVYGAATAVIVGALLAIAGPLLQDVEHAVEDVAELHRYVDQNWREGNGFQRYIVELLPPFDEPLQPVATLEGDSLLWGILGMGGSLFGLIIAVFLTIVVSIYWSIDYDRIERLWLLLLPLKYRISARDVWRRIQAEVGTYMRSELLQAAAAGAVLGVAFSWSGFPFPVAMALLVAVAWLVPWIGPLLAVAAVAAASVLNFMDVTPAAGWARLAICSGFVLLVFVVLEFYVEPKLHDQRRYSSLLVLVITVMLLQLVGVVALLLGPPVTIALQIVAGRLLSRHSSDDGIRRPDDASALRKRLADVRALLEDADIECPPELESICGRLEKLLDESEKAAAMPSPKRPC